MLFEIWVYIIYYTAVDMTIQSQTLTASADFWYNTYMKKRTEFIQQLQEKVTVVAVSKNRSRNEIEQLFHEGIHYFGENKVQQLLSKVQSDDPWQWHFIGHLQTNKVKDVVSCCSLIHSVDSKRLILEIEKQAARTHKVMDILIQINLSDETSKFGCLREEVKDLFQLAQLCEHIRVRGMMVMGPLTDDPSQTASVFREARQWFSEMKKTHPHIDTLSMGMSDDYPLAIDHGSTMVRIGTLLFEWDQSKNIQPQ